MPIQVSCEKCGRQLRVGDNLAGKKIKCPQCQNILTVTADSPADSPASEPAPAARSKPVAAPQAPASAAVKTGPKTTNDTKPVEQKPVEKEKKVEKVKVEKKAAVVVSYFVKIEEDGETYGPVTRSELEEWVAEGRLDEHSQLLQEGDEQWQWAIDFFPDLESAGEEDDSRAAAPAAGADAPSQAAAKAAANGAAAQQPAKGAAEKRSRWAEDDESQAPADDERPESSLDDDAPREDDLHEEDQDADPEERPVRGRATSASKTAATGKDAGKNAGKNASKSSRKAPARRPQSDGEHEADDQPDSDRAQLVAGLLAIFLGVTGAHRFYLGYVLHGVLQAMTCGGALVWVIVDIVQILRGRMTDVHGRPLQK